MYPYFEEDINKIKTNDLDDRFDLDEDDIFENEILELLLEAISQEDEDIRYFQKLEKMLKNTKDKDMIRKIMLDDKKHFKIFSEIYKSLTGKEPIFEKEEVEIDDSLIEEIFDSIEQKLENVELYRLLLSSFLDVGIRDLIFEIITDEQAHAQKLTQIHNRNK